MHHGFSRPVSWIKWDCCPGVLFGCEGNGGVFFSHIFSIHSIDPFYAAPGGQCLAPIYLGPGDIFMDEVECNGKVRSKIINPIHTNTRGGQQNMVSQLPRWEVMWTLK